jgi:acetylornithine deacetylase/succinyl-diaminopimelate desuccinylase-like protein
MNERFNNLYYLKIVFSDPKALLRDTFRRESWIEPITTAKELMQIHRGLRGKIDAGVVLVGVPGLSGILFGLSAGPLAGVAAAVASWGFEGVINYRLRSAGIIKRP